MIQARDSQSTITLSQLLTKFFLILTLVTLVVSAWLLVSWLYKPGNFPIRKVELVNKLENQESRELQQIAAKSLNGGFFSLDVERFRADLLAKLPWVNSVSVRKIWPNRLLVSISEHKPVVRWLSVEKKDSNKSIDKTHSLQWAEDSKLANGLQQANGFELLSHEGVVFGPDLTEAQQVNFEKMALLTGPRSSAGKVLETCLQINEQMKQLATGINQCGMNERRTWMVILDNGIDIKLGKENIMQQLERFVRVFSGQLKQYIGSVDYADLRYSNGFSIKWNSENALQNNAN